MSTALASLTIADMQRRIAWMDALSERILAELAQKEKQK